MASLQQAALERLLSLTDEGVKVDFHLKLGEAPARRACIPSRRALG